MKQIEKVSVSKDQAEKAQAVIDFSGDMPSGEGKYQIRTTLEEKAQKNETLFAAHRSTNGTLGAETGCNRLRTMGESRQKFIFILT